MNQCNWSNQYQKRMPFFISSSWCPYKDMHCSPKRVASRQWLRKRFNRATIQYCKVENKTEKVGVRLRRKKMLLGMCLIVKFSSVSLRILRLQVENLPGSTPVLIQYKANTLFPLFNKITIQILYLFLKTKPLCFYCSILKTRISKHKYIYMWT